MGYPNSLWNNYTDENESPLEHSPADFIYHMSLGLGSKTICEFGCNVGNNLTGFPSSVEVTGVDLNKHAIEKASKIYPSFNFKQSDISFTPFDDSSSDLVFTRGVLIHIPDESLDSVLTEMLRVSKKWIFNLEYFGDDGKMINWKRGDDLLWYRNMHERWSKFDVEILSDIQLPLSMDSGNTKFTLIRKK